MTLTYNPRVFDCGTLQDAMQIVLTAEDGLSTNERWLKETPYLAGLAVERLRLTTDSVVLDYGCGVGRLAKEIIRRVGCTVVGADISPTMRAYAAHYVNSEKFIACHPNALKLFQPFTAGLAVWVLQHCVDVDSDIDRLSSVLMPQAPLFVVNNKQRVVPFVRGNESGWADDKRDVQEALKRKFTPDAAGSLDASHVGKSISELTYWGVYFA